jgi:hypothetical protein
MEAKAADSGCDVVMAQRALVVARIVGVTTWCFEVCEVIDPANVT